MVNHNEMPSLFGSERRRSEVDNQNTISTSQSARDDNGEAIVKDVCRDDSTLERTLPSELLPRRNTNAEGNRIPTFTNDIFSRNKVEKDQFSSCVPDNYHRAVNVDVASTLLDSGNNNRDSLFIYNERDDENLCNDNNKTNISETEMYSRVKTNEKCEFSFTDTINNTLPLGKPSECNTTSRLQTYRIDNNPNQFTSTPTKSNIRSSTYDEQSCELPTSSFITNSCTQSNHTCEHTYSAKPLRGISKGYPSNALHNNVYQTYLNITSMYDRSHSKDSIHSVSPVSHTKLNDDNENQVNIEGQIDGNVKIIPTSDLKKLSESLNDIQYDYAKPNTNIHINKTHGSEVKNTIKLDRSSTLKNFKQEEYVCNNSINRETNERKTGNNSNLIPVKDLKRLSTLLSNLANIELPNNRDVVSKENSPAHEDDDLQKLAKSLHSIPYEELDNMKKVANANKKRNWTDTVAMSLRDVSKQTSSTKKRRINAKMIDDDISQIYEHIINHELYSNDSDVDTIDGESFSELDDLEELEELEDKSEITRRDNVENAARTESTTRLRELVSVNIDSAIEEAAANRTMLKSESKISCESILSDLSDATMDKTKDNLMRRYLKQQRNSIKISNKRSRSIKRYSSTSSWPMKKRTKLNEVDTSNITVKYNYNGSKLKKIVDEKNTTNEKEYTQLKDKNNKLTTIQERDNQDTINIITCSDLKKLKESLHNLPDDSTKSSSVTDISKHLKKRYRCESDNRKTELQETTTRNYKKRRIQEKKSDAEMSAKFENILINEMHNQKDDSTKKTSDDSIGNTRISNDDSREEVTHSSNDNDVDEVHSDLSSNELEGWQYGNDTFDSVSSIHSSSTHSTISLPAFVPIDSDLEDIDTASEERAASRTSLESESTISCDSALRSLSHTNIEKKTDQLMNRYLRQQRNSIAPSRKRSRSIERNVSTKSVSMKRVKLHRVEKLTSSDIEINTAERPIKKEVIVDDTTSDEEGNEAIDTRDSCTKSKDGNDDEFINNNTFG